MSDGTFLKTLRVDKVSHQKLKEIAVHKEIFINNLVVELIEEAYKKFCNTKKFRKYYGE